MAVTYGFYNSLNGDRKYYAEQMSSIFNGIITDGVFSAIGDALMTVAGSATSMQVIVKTGRAWFNGTWTQNDAQLPLDISTADVSLTRIDAVVLEINTSNSVRANSIKVVKGIASANPQKPTLMNENLIHQYALAYVTVPAGATSISASNIEVNVGKTGCPFITSVLQQADITDVFNQWEAEFDKWFANVKSSLSGDIAANLQRQIDEVNDKVTETDSVVSELKKDRGLKIGDILMTSTTDPGSEFVECNGQAIDYQPGIDLPIGASKLSTATNTTPYIAMKSDNECGLFYANASSNATALYMTFVRDIKNGLCDTPVVVYSGDKAIDSHCGAYFNGTWIGVVSIGYYDLYIYTASDPQGAWTETHISLRSSDEGGAVYNIRVINGYAVIVWSAYRKSNDTILIYTDDLSKPWNKNVVNYAYAYNGMDIGYYAGHYFLLNINSSSNYRSYCVSYASDLNASVWRPLGDYFTGNTFMYCYHYSCQSDGLYLLVSGSSAGYKILKITSFNPLNVETCYSIAASDSNRYLGYVDYAGTFGRCNGKWYLFYTYQEYASTYNTDVINMIDDLSKGIHTNNIQSYYSIDDFKSRGYAEYDKIVLPTKFYIFTNALMQLPEIKTVGLHYFLKISDTE